MTHEVQIVQVPIEELRPDPDGRGEERTGRGGRLLARGTTRRSCQDHGRDSSGKRGWNQRSDLKASQGSPGGRCGTGIGRQRREGLMVLATPKRSARCSCPRECR